jgi:hypothetical protein
MGEDSVSRRAALKMIGVGAAGATLAKEPVARAEMEAEKPSEAGSATQPSEESALLTPLVEGSQLGRWRVERIVPADGALSVVVSDSEGRHFQLDVCARDLTPGAPRAPGESEHFQVFLANRGDGSTDTFEDHGLAAMALAEVIRGNEASVSRSEFVTLAERLARASARVHVD